MMAAAATTGILQALLNNIENLFLQHCCQWRPKEAALAASLLIDSGTTEATVSAAN